MNNAWRSTGLFRQTKHSGDFWLHIHQEQERVNGFKVWDCSVLDAHGYTLAISGPVILGETNAKGWCEAKARELSRTLAKL